MELTHFNKKNKKIEMVDISIKNKTKRVAEAKGLVKINKKLYLILKNDQNIFEKLSTTAKIAGILAAKNTSNSIPLTHNIPIDYINLSFNLENDQFIEIKSIIKSNYTTGLEIEALSAVSTAALTIFDMLKSYKQKILIQSIEITKKRGGKNNVG